MFFCPNCNYTFDITKNTQIGKGKNENNIKTTQTSDKVDNILAEAQTITSSNTENISDILPVQKDEQISNLNKNLAYFSCNNCGNVQPIDPGTCIYTKTSYDVSQNYTSSNMKLMIHSTILPFTKNYNCANKQCLTHKDPSKKKAKMFKPNNTYKVKYICMVCKTIF